MRVQKFSKVVGCCFMAFVASSLFFSMSSQANADTTYTVTGFANNNGFGSQSTAVGIDEAYTAIFQIDNSVLDSDPSDTNRGLYNSSILSSTISFAGGHVSDVNFAGGNVTVRPDFGGGGIILTSPDQRGNLVLFQEDALASDALLAEGQQLTGLAGGSSLFSLSDSSGAILSFSQPETAAVSARSGVGSARAANGPIVLTVSAVPEPSSMALLGLGLVIASVRRKKS